MIPNEALSVGTFNARRLWYGDGSLHDGFRVLTHILSVWSISVLCIQEVQAGEFPSLPVDQPCHYDGPEGTFGREAAFLVRDRVRSVPVSGVDDTTSVRCICSFYALHAGVPIDGLPPLRDWAPTLLRAHGALLLWSSRLDALLCGAACTFSAPVPSQPASLVDVGVFRSMCGTQWCVAGFQACPGSSRPQSLLRCTDPFPSDCQELPGFILVSLARSCCQSFPGEPTCWPEGQDPLEQWRQHFMSVGSRSSSSFDPSFHADIMRRFADLCALPPVSGVFDSPFPTSELRCALSRCVESAVGLDGLPLLPLQGDVSLVAECVGEPCLGVGCCPIFVEAQHRCPHFQARGPFVPREFSSSVSGVLLLQSFGALDSRVYCPIHQPTAQ